MDDDLVVATSSSSTDSNYGFIVTVRFTKYVVVLTMQDICELNGHSIELASLSCQALFAAVNKTLNDLHITPDSHRPSDASRFITNDDQLQKVLAFERRYGRLFRWFLNSTPQALISHHHHKHNLPSL